MNTPANTALNVWKAEGESLAHTHRNLLWDIADWLERGVREFGDAAQEIALVQFGRSKGELEKAMDLSKRFPADTRHASLSFSHYKIVEKLSDEKANEVLDEAVRTKASASALKKTVSDLREAPGGDIHRQMAGVSQDELNDEWWDAVVKLMNRSPSGVDGRRDVCEAFEEVEFKVVY